MDDLDQGDLLMLHRKYPWLLLLLAGGCLSASLLHARVYFSQSVDLFNPASFGRLIYKTIMEINGGKAEVNVVGCDDGLDPVKAALGTHLDPRLRVVALGSDSERPALLVTVVQSPAEQNTSQSIRARHRITDVPVPSDGLVLSTLNSSDTRSTLECLSSRMGKDDLVRFYEAAMARTGWTKLVAAAEGSGLMIYIKGADICVVMVTMQESNGESGVTLLHKQGAVN